MNAREKKAIQAAMRRVEREISGVASSGGMYARGMAAEGYAGGYLQALRDVMILNMTTPNTRNYWDNDNG